MIAYSPVENDLLGIAVAELKQRFPEARGGGDVELPAETQSVTALASDILDLELTGPRRPDVHRRADHRSASAAGLDRRRERAHRQRGQHR
jgi:hypothetical protein